MNEKHEVSEDQNQEENSQWKLPFHEVEKLYDQAMLKLGKIENDMERVAASVFYGYHKGWNLAKTIKYYSLPKEIAKNIWSKFDFPEKGGEQSVTTRTRSKQDVIVGFLKTNVGKVITPAEVAKNVNISLPTFYNFYNANRHFFKKVQRGKFEILNPEEERQKA
jgi:hypothetical protein